MKKPTTNWRERIEASQQRLNEVASNPAHTPEEFCKAAQGAFIERTASIRADDMQEESRTVSLSFSSEEPYERSFGFEILGHKNDEIRLARLLDGAPLLVGHDSRQHVGIVESATIDSDRRARAVVRIGDHSSLANETFRGVQTGILQKVSVGYEVHEMELVSEVEGERSYRVTDWEPFEISLVSMPADTTVGVGRQADPLSKPIVKELQKVTEKNKPETPAEKPAPSVDVSAVRESAIEAERARVNDINEQGAKHGMPELAAEFVRNGKDGDAFRDAILDKLVERGTFKPADPDTKIGLTSKEASEFSFLRIIEALSNPGKPQAQKAAAFELDVCETAAKKYRRETGPMGFTVPDDVLMAPMKQRGYKAKRDVNTSVALQGGNLVGTDLRGQSFVEILRNATQVIGLGATVLGDLVGNIAIPRQSGKSSGFWISTEGGASTEQTQNFDQVTGTPKTVGSNTDITRQMRLQSSIDIEALVRSDLAIGLATAKDLAALYGSGASGQPTGITLTSGINAPTAFAAAVPTWAEVTTMIGAAAGANALQGSLAWLINGQDMGSLMSQTKDTGSGQFIYDSGMIAGYNAPVSNQVTLGDYFFADWSQMFIFEWGGIDITVDPYTNSKSGTVSVTALHSCDIGLRHPESFTYNNDT